MPRKKTQRNWERLQEKIKEYLFKQFYMGNLGFPSLPNGKKKRLFTDQAEEISRQKARTIVDMVKGWDQQEREKIKKASHDLESETP